VEVFGIIGLALILSMLAFALWVLRRHNRMFPPGTRVGELDDEWKREPRWTGMWHRGGEGGM
jgi:hypothetical protein